MVSTTRATIIMSIGICLTPASATPSYPTCTAGNGHCSGGYLPSCPSGAEYICEYDTLADGHSHYGCEGEAPDICTDTELIDESHPTCIAAGTGSCSGDYMPICPSGAEYICAHGTPLADGRPQYGCEGEAPDTCAEPELVESFPGGLPTCIAAGDGSCSGDYLPSCPSGAAAVCEHGTPLADGRPQYGCEGESPDHCTATELIDESHPTRTKTCTPTHLG